MALLGLFGALAIVTVATLWAGVKLSKWVLTSDDSDAAYQYVRATMELVKPVWVSIVLLVALLELWPGVSSWLTGAFEMVIKIW